MIYGRGIGPLGKKKTVLRLKSELFLFIIFFAGAPILFRNDRLYVSRFLISLI